MRRSVATGWFACTSSGRLDKAPGPAQGRRRAETSGGGRCAPRLPWAEREGPPLRRQGPQNIFALRVRSAEDLLLPPLPAEPLRPIGAAATARPGTHLADSTPEGATAMKATHATGLVTDATNTGDVTAIFCPECGDDVEDLAPENYLVPGVRPGNRHVSDRTALCPVMTG